MRPSPTGGVGSAAGVEVRFDGPVTVEHDLATFEVIVPARGEWSTCIEVAPIIDGTTIDPRNRCGQPVDRAEPAERLARWRRQVPQVETDHPGLKQVVARSAEDLGALRIFDPDFPERVVVAAGAPWFMTVFGRDSLLTAWMALLVDPDLALGVLQTLARFQGKDVDPRTTRSRAGSSTRCASATPPPSPSAAGASTTAPPTPRPCSSCCSGELRRWGLARELVDELLPNAERAIEWIEQFGDADGDGYVEYHRATDRGLANQGWKDSWDGIRYADGPGGRGPHRPLRGAGLRLRRLPGPGPLRLRGRATTPPTTGSGPRPPQLKTAFNRDFWLEDKGLVRRRASTPTSGPSTR